MKTPKEYTSKYKYYPTIPVKVVNSIIKEAQPKWWVIENPFNGRLKEILGKPKYVYQPWEYGSPWTKKRLCGENLIYLKRNILIGIKCLK